MNTNPNPWRRPGAQQLHTLIGGNPVADSMLTRVVEQLGLDELSWLTGAVYALMREAIRDGAATGREEVLAAVARVMLERPEGIDEERLAVLRHWAGVSGDDDSR